MPSGSRHLTRREWLATVPTAIAAGAIACRRRPYRAADFAVPTRSSVGLFSAPTYDADFADLIARGLRELSVDVRGKSAFLKPNLVEYTPGTAINTHPRVVAGAATALLQAGASEVVVGEGPGHRRDLEYLLAGSGLADALRDARLRFVDLNHDDARVVPLRSQFTGLAGLALPATLLAADFVVTMPKLKTHHWAAMTASMKNLFGVVPGAIYGWPKNILHFHGIENSILDLTATVRPQLSIVDAVVSMEGDGPIMGSPRETGFIAMGTDVVAVDATCARLMGFDPMRVGYLAQASEFLGNVGIDRIEQRGEALRRFETRFSVLDVFEGLRVASGG